MTTGSFVGSVGADGRFTAYTVTYDGYPSGVGAALARLLVEPWARRSPARLLEELAAYPHWWSIGPGRDEHSRVGHPNRRPEEEGWLLPVSGRLGCRYRGQQEWGYLFRGEQELVVVRVGQWWQTPAYPVQRWATIPVEVIDAVDWHRLERTGERNWPPTP